VIGDQTVMSHRSRHRRIGLVVDPKMMADRPGRDIEHQVADIADGAHSRRTAAPG